MSKDQLRQALQTKPKPRFNINLQDFAPITSNPTSFDFSFNIQDPSTISSSPELPCIAEFQQFYIQNLSSIKESAKRFVLKNKAEEILGEKRQEKATRK